MQYMYTLAVKNQEMADKLKQSIPPGLQRIEIPKSK